MALLKLIRKIKASLSAEKKEGNGTAGLNAPARKPGSGDANRRNGKDGRRQPTDQRRQHDSRRKPKQRQDDPRTRSVEWSPSEGSREKPPRRERQQAPRERQTPREPAAPAIPDTPWDPSVFQVEPVEGKKRFHDFDLPEQVMRGIYEAGFKYCSPIQAETLNQTMSGLNVAGKAQTGTGKTAAYLIAVFCQLLAKPDKRPKTTGKPAALVIAPTRELVMQIVKDAEMLGKFCGVRCIAVYGGMEHAAQQDRLKEAPVDIIAATPGRLIDFMRLKVVDLKEVHTLVIDEADRMLDMGFIPDVRKIISRLPPKENRQTLLFSATLNDSVMSLASQWMPDPIMVSVDPEHGTVDTIRQVVYPIASKEKFTVLFNTLKKHEGKRFLIFRNRKRDCDDLCRDLESHGISVEQLSGDVDQKKRIRILEDFRAGKIKIVVATDVAGRGIHVDDIAYVINYDFPYEADDYIHRIGRTGRAGSTGTAISFACEDESFIIPDIEKLLGEELHCQQPDELLFSEVPAATHTPRQRNRGEGYGGDRRGGRPSSGRHGGASGGFRRPRSTVRTGK